MGLSLFQYRQLCKQNLLLTNLSAAWCSCGSQQIEQPQTAKLWCVQDPASEQQIRRYAGPFANELEKLILLRMWTHTAQQLCACKRVSIIHPLTWEQVSHHGVITALQTSWSMQHVTVVAFEPCLEVVVQPPSV